MAKLFGTDGVRGRSNTYPMDAETVLKIGMAAGAFFTRGGHRHRVIIGKDTRLSGYMIEPALTAGFIAMGMDVFLVGPLPTPAIAMITRSMRADVGVMISASHNPFEDNGIKFFLPNGLKLSDEAQTEIENLVTADLNKFKATPENIGRARRIEDAAGRYIESVKQSFPKRVRLDGLKIVLDCANGAAYKIAPTVLWELGADVIKIGADPDGYNINENCGSTYPKVLCEKVLEVGADIGIALDGDADRVIISDENGKIIDGDQIMGAIAEYWHSKGQLTGGGIVATIMSNMGLDKFLQGHDLKLERANVGDRYVSEKMREGGYNFGGEQSGHIIFNDYTTTGDGLVAALQTLAKMVESGKPASKALRVFEPMPQILKNIKYDAKRSNPLENDSVINFVKKAEKYLNKSGRIVIRKSGTEPLIRVMVEGESAEEIDRISDDIIEKIKAC